MSRNGPSKSWTQTVFDSQLLLGSDQAILHPRCVCNPTTGLPIESNNARLLKSVITEKYLAYGFQDPSMTLNINQLDLHDPAPTANSIQLHADPQEICIINSEEEEPMTVDAEGIEMIYITSDEDNEIIGHKDLIQL